MPLHDWSNMADGEVHGLHVAWTSSIAHALNMGGLPPGFRALPERIISIDAQFEPDVLTVQSGETPEKWQSPAVALAEAPPSKSTAEMIDPYRSKQLRLRILSESGRPVAAIEIVSRSNKRSERQTVDFAKKCVEMMDAGLHLTIIDILPTDSEATNIPNQIAAIYGRDPVSFDDPIDRYAASYRVTAAHNEIQSSQLFFEPFQIGNDLPSPALFLDADHYVKLPLEDSYRFALESVGLQDWNRTD